MSLSLGNCLSKLSGFAISTRHWTGKCDVTIMTDEAARIGNTVQAWRLLQQGREKHSLEGYVSLEHQSCKNTQFIKDVFIHTFPNEGNESSQSLRYLQWVRSGRRRSSPSTLGPTQGIFQNKKNELTDSKEILENFFRFTYIQSLVVVGNLFPFCYFKSE